MPEGPVFYNNNDQLGNDDGSLSNFVTLGDGLIKVYKDTGADRVLAVSFVEEAIVQNIDQDYNLARIGGIPLSVSVCSDESLNPSGLGVGFFHALDVIIYSRAVDLIDNNTVPSKPVVNGVEVGVGKVDDIYYLKTHQVSTTPNPTGLIHFGGVPMSYGSENELLIRDSGYAFSDVDRYETLNFFGVPIKVGYVDAENKYYLIVDPHVNLTDYTVVQYKMNDNDKTTTVRDSQGFSNGTSLSNTVADVGKINGALKINGFSGYINTNQTFNSTFVNSFSINLWHKMDDGQPGNETMIFAREYSTADTVQISHDINLKLFYSSNGNSCSISVATPYVNGQETWHMLTITVNEDDTANITAKIYNDGVEIATATNAVVMNDFNKLVTFWIGGENSPSAFGDFDGSIDNFCIFSKTLTQEEIDFLYNDGNGTEELNN